MYKLNLNIFSLIRTLCRRIEKNVEREKKNDGEDITGCVSEWGFGPFL